MKPPTKCEMDELLRHCCDGSCQVEQCQMRARDFRTIPFDRWDDFSRYTLRRLREGDDSWRFFQ